MPISYEKVKKVIDEWDPIELLSAHAPSDEYDSESKEVFTMLQRNPDIGVSDLIRLMHDVFTSAFGDDVFKQTLSECAAVAEKLLRK